MLSEFDYECARASGATPRQEPARGLERVHRRACVLRKYEAALGSSDFALTIQLELSAQRPAAPSIEDAPIVAPLASLHWGSDELLVPMPLSAAPAASGQARMP